MPEILQADWSGGIWAGADGQAAPANTALDIVNGLCDLPPGVYERGGTTYRTAADLFGSRIVGVADVNVGGGQRTLFWQDGTLYVLAADDVTPVQIAARAPAAGAQLGAVRGMAVFTTPDLPYALGLYGGSRKTADYAAGTVSVTNGSPTVTGSGTAWLANVDAGMILAGANAAHVIQSVDSNTQLTLREGWAGHTDATLVYQARPVAYVTTPLPASGLLPAVAMVGTPGRAVVATGAKAYVSKQGLVADPDDTIPFDLTDYHEIPEAVQTLGVASIRDTAFWFTSAGVWSISNLNFELTDAGGNPQRTVVHLSEDLVLWQAPDRAGASGVASWNDLLVVPAVDDVYLLGVDGSRRSIGKPILQLWRSITGGTNYPGSAVIYRGHYVLPITAFDGTPVEFLVCRLESGAWTRFSGHAMSSGLSVRPRSGGQVERLLAASGTRVADLTGCFKPTGALDADGTTHPLQVTTRDFVAAPHLGTTWQRIRLRYELADPSTVDPTISAEWAEGAGAFASLGAPAGESDGTSSAWWPIVKRRQSIRFRFTTVGPSVGASLRTLSVKYRASGRR